VVGGESDEKAVHLSTTERLIDLLSRRPLRVSGVDELQTLYRLLDGGDACLLFIQRRRREGGHKARRVERTVVGWGHTRRAGWWRSGGVKR